MFRSYLFMSLFLSAFLISGGCAKKTVPDVSVSPAPAATQPANDPPEKTAVETKPVASSSVETLINLDDEKIETVFFEFDSYVLTADAHQLLRNTAGLLLKNREEKATLEGHCDERGSDEYNLALGERRALATKNYLVDRGIAEERLTIISYGEERPASVGHNELAWRQNRRVVFK
ncbi:MAG: peptidoglycan-associated lipoprotein Pal [Desulfuromusa sp.]